MVFSVHLPLLALYINVLKAMAKIFQEQIEQCRAQRVSLFIPAEMVNSSVTPAGSLTLEIPEVCICFIIL